MKLSEVQRYWDRQAHSDPMWAILTDPAKAGGRWNVDEFFATGVRDISSVMEQAAAWGKPVARSSALDFGCGIGRLSQALADHFDHVYGVDISPKMIELARQHNRKGSRVEYRCNPAANLGEFEDASIDMVYSWITLQHVRALYARRYMREFLRVLAPGGLLLFQYPSKPVSWRSHLGRWRALWSVPRPMYMNGMDRKQVVELLERGGGRVLEIRQDDESIPGYHSFCYAVTRD
ncbi:MAG TPA: class I SAM-dependent methyltransferase [Bryobacteraceae bacterium]|jgi:SAM-dependent methyltransferase|nr:class I SAM-dependent methyltransferase [Bryobacteraceae bacterium]